jgi:hypothetical protein
MSKSLHRIHDTVLEKPFVLGWGWIPLFSGLIWLSGLLTLLGIWCSEGNPQYQPGEGAIVYISDIGAHKKALFIGTFHCILMFTFVSLSNKY